MRFFLSIAFLIFSLQLFPKSALPVQEQYSAMLSANQQEDWKQLIKQSETLLEHHRQSPFAQDALFYLAVGLYHDEEYESANQHFSEYLKQQSTPKHFEEAIQHKYAIAEKFKLGAKKHLFGAKLLPRWMPAESDALEIYDEVIAALPHHELAAAALYSKAHILLEEEDYRASLEAFQTLIRRFPKHPLAAESYVGICNVYLVQSQQEYPDPDFLDLAEINLKKFNVNFPREERIGVAEGLFAKMQEHYAQNLFETGRFFERTKKYSAATIYYSKILLSFPKTRTATFAKERLEIAKAKAASV